MKTKERLAQALREAGLTDMAERAARGYYDDYESELDAPCMALVKDLQTAGRTDMAERAMRGEWDGTKEEGEAWMKREGRDLLKDLGL